MIERPTHNHSKVLGLYIVVCDGLGEYFLVLSRGSEDALDALSERGVDLDWHEVTSVRKVQMNVDGERGCVHSGRVHFHKNFRQHPAPNRKPHAPLAQQDRASEFYSEGCGSESCGVRQS